MKRMNYRRMLVVVLVVAVVLRFVLALMAYPSGDGAWHLSAARFIARNHYIPFDEPVGRAEPFWPAPLFHVVAAFFYSVLGDAGMKLVSPLFGSLSLILAFVIVRKLYSEEIAFFAVLFLSFVPIHIYHSALPLIEAMTAFLVLLCIFFLLERHFYLSALSTGLLLLAKPTAIFIFPLLLLLLYRFYREDFVRKAVIFFVVAFVVSFPWYLRNFILFGNPVWPYLNVFFHGLPSPGFGQGFSPGNLLHFDYIFSVAYLETFGVPNGDWNAFSYLSVPCKGFVLLVWFIATLLFALPLLFGFFTANFRDKNSWLLLCWLLPFLFFIAVLLTHFPMMNTRYLLPVFLVLAVFWAAGLVRLARRIPFSLLLLLLSFCILVFVSAEFVKANVAANQWGFYGDDFSWVKANSGRNDTVWLFKNGSQTFGYSLDRPIRFFGSPSDISGGYVFLNQDFRLDFIKAPDGIYSQFGSDKRFKLVYSNPRTKTEVLVVV